MHETKGKNILSQLRRKWIYKILLSQFLTALALTVFITGPLIKFFFLPSYWAIAFFIISFLITAVINPWWTLNELDISKYLNSTQPSLQESAHLVLMPQSALNSLEKLQAKKVEYAFLSLKAAHPFKKQMAMAFITLFLAISATAVLFLIPTKPGFITGAGTTRHTSLITSPPEILLPEIRAASIIITPPLYTGKGPRHQSVFNLLTEEGANVSWQIQTSMPVKEVELIFNSGPTLRLVSSSGQVTWQSQMVIKTSGFYQVKIDSNLSEFYKIEAIKDQPPTIAIQSPRPGTFINYGAPGKVSLNATLADDYGIKLADVSATISRGQGEAVKFTEHKLLLKNFTPNRREDHLQKLIDCKALGMVPGDELYFFISVTDNHNQLTRSDVYTITLQDTTALQGMDGMVTALDIRPELFRSERQIIIETEQLLKNKAAMTADTFKEKSSDLGVDQKLLRLRYGKFLGEEINTETGKDDEHEEKLNNKQNTGNTNEIVKKYGHEHDNAEDATFFDAATKNQLKSMLTEMWKAELKLRTFAPKEALRYENKALQLLKELQENSRAYVQKTGIKVSPLTADKRLTGDLSKISEAVTQENIDKPDAPAITTRSALGILEQLKIDGRLSIPSKDILQQAFKQLILKTADQPAAYLTSLSALKKILDGKYTAKDLDNAEQGLQQMTVNIEKLPYNNSNALMNLSRQYFINLNKVSK